MAHVELAQLTCDRCGFVQQFMPDEAFEGWEELTTESGRFLVLGNRVRDREAFDLCPHCCTALKQFLAGYTIDAVSKDTVVKP